MKMARKRKSRAKLMKKFVEVGMTGDNARAQYFLAQASVLKGRKKRRNRKRKSRKGGGMASMGRAMAVCSITNPFCYDAIGARYPDNSYQKSIPLSFTGFQNALSTDANGNGARMFFPGLGMALNTPSSITAGTITWAATGGGLVGSSVPAGAARWRITSMGLRISCSTPLMTTQGIVTISIYSMMDGGYFASTNITDQLCDYMVQIPAARLVEEDQLIVLKPIGPNARLFLDLNKETTTLANWVNPGWQVAQVTLAGGIASNTQGLTINAYYNYELTFAAGSTYEALAAAPPVDDPVVKQASSSVLATIGNHIEGGVAFADRLFQSTAVRALAGAAIGGMLGGPAGAASGASMGTMMVSGRAQRPYHPGVWHGDVD